MVPDMAAEPSFLNDRLQDFSRSTSVSFDVLHVCVRPDACVGPSAHKAGPVLLLLVANPQQSSLLLLRIQDRGSEG